MPDPEPSVNFTPVLWEKIEARRSSFTIMRRLTHGLVSLATAAALVLGVFVIPQVQNRRALSTSYAEVVAEEGNSAQEIATAFAAPLTPVTGVPAQ
ncbi:MAG: hypothetical protein JST65_08170 [Acidobacteria bacterium]|nr:hypothetical protein [Acidobacteriota bacterium]